MFLGQYDHTIDEKGRMTIPSRFREMLAEGAYITQGFDQNLFVLPKADFEKLYARINQMNLADPAARQLRRLVFANAEWVEFDKAGRILIPQFLRQAALLVGSAMVVGAGYYFEIWSPETWQKQNGDLMNSEANAQRFAPLDLSIS
jgi:MraZ protein